MADATQYPTNTVLTVFQWARPAAATPRLAAPITSTDTTIYFTDAPKDSAGAVITSGFLMGIKNATTGYVETVYVPAGKVQADGLSAIDCVRGIKPSGIDYTVGSASFASNHPQDSSVFCNISAIYHTMMISTLNGTIASGGNNWYIGNGTASDITVYGYNNAGNKPFWRFDNATSQWVYSNDGIATTPFGTGAGITGGDGITVTAGDIDIDLTDTVIFRTTRSGNETRAVATVAADGLISSTFLAEPLASLISAGVTSAEIDQVCDGVSANVTAANLSTLTAGAASNAESLHTHTVINSGTTSIAMGSVPGTSVIAHGLGVTPKAITFTALASATIWSHGVWDGTENRATYPSSKTDSYSIYCDNAGAIARGVVSSADATNFTITWSKVGIGINVNGVLWTAIA